MGLLSCKGKGTPRAGLTPEQTGAIARALADARRFAILQQVAGTDTLLCSDLRVQEMLSPATISHHLKELSEAGLIEIEREGRCARLSLRREIWSAYLQRLGEL